METIVKDYGKIGVTVDEGIYSPSKSYEKLTIVKTEDNKVYLSRKDVPASLSIDIDNEEYWFRLSGNNVEPSKVDDEFSPLVLDEMVESYLTNVSYISNNFLYSDIEYYNKDKRIVDKPLSVRILIGETITGYISYYISDFINNEPQCKVDINNSNYVEITNLIPNYYYLYKIYKEDNSLVKSGFIKPRGHRRFINLPDGYNVRDFGGIRTADGHKLRYNKIIRGSELTQNDKTVLNKNIYNLDSIIIDLRNENEREGKYIDSTSINFPNFPTYSDVNHLTDVQKRTITIAVFNILSNIQRYCYIYINCVWGAHRTGLLSSILLNLLGVSQSEIDKDYELTSFDKDYVNDNLRRDKDDFGYRTGNQFIRDNYGGKWENFLIENYISKELIEDFRRTMIEDYDTNNVKVSGDVFYNVTYRELVNLSNSGLLKPGCKYRVVDYKTMVSLDEEIAYNGSTEEQVEVTSDEIPFNIILTALSDRTLDSVANIIEEDEDKPRFGEYDLSKFKVWYNLKNDKSKYGWANLEGYGVIYRMIDDRGNDVPYDFLNIKFDEKYTFNTQKVIEPYIGYTSGHRDHVKFNSNPIAYKYRYLLSYWSYIADSYYFYIIDYSSNPEGLIAGALNKVIHIHIIFADGGFSNIYISPGISVQDEYVTIKYLGNYEGLSFYKINAKGIIHIYQSYSYTPFLIKSYQKNNINKNIIIKPYIKNNIQHLNGNIIISSGNDNVNNIYFGSNCRNNIITDSSNINFGANCYNNELVDSNNIYIKESSIFNKLESCNRVDLGSFNVYGNLNNCKNVDIDSYMYQLGLENKGSEDENISVKHQNSSILLV